MAVGREEFLEEVRTKDRLRVLLEESDYEIRNHQNNKNSRYAQNTSVLNLSDLFSNVHYLQSILYNYLRLRY